MKKNVPWNEWRQSFDDNRHFQAAKICALLYLAIKIVLGNIFGFKVHAKCERKCEFQNRYTFQPNKFTAALRILNLFGFKFANRIIPFVCVTSIYRPIHSASVAIKFNLWLIIFAKLASSTWIISTRIQSSTATFLFKEPFNVT